MPATFHPTNLPDVILIKPRAFPDPRGYFKETYHRAGYADAGIHVEFVQDNFSQSSQSTLRGLHFQYQQSQDKLIQCLRGAIYDVAVDIRVGSPTFGHWTSAELSSENHHQLFVPKGFAHGFCVLSEQVDVFYKCSDFYAPQYDAGIRWNSIDIPWPVAHPLLSDKDAALPTLDTIDPATLPQYTQ